MLCSADVAWNIKLFKLPVDVPKSLKIKVSCSAITPPPSINIIGNELSLVPTTCNVASGLAVFIPIFPLPSKTKVSVGFPPSILNGVTVLVPSTKYNPLVVPLLCHEKVELSVVISNIA